MQYNREAKIGRKFGDGKQWYPNLMSAIMNRQMQKGSTISKSLPEMLAYVAVVKHRYERRFIHTCTQCGGTENLNKIAPMKPHKVYYLCSKCKEDILKREEEMMAEDMKEYRSITQGLFN